MPTEAQRKANRKQDGTRKRVPLWLDAEGPELKELERIMRKQKLPDRMAALRFVLGIELDG